MFSYYTIRGIRIVIGIIALSFLLFAGNAGAAFPGIAPYAPGDLILAQEWIYLPSWESGCEKNTTLLKEGYMLSLDRVKEMGEIFAYFSLYKNNKIVKRFKGNSGDFFYYNRTIDGNEYTIIKFKVDAIFSDGDCSSFLVRIKPFFQYSDGTGGQEIPIGNSVIPPSEEWNRTFRGLDENAIEPVENTGYDGYTFFRSSSLELSVQETKDGDFILARSYIPASWKLPGSPILLNRTDADGNELWNKTISEPRIQVYSIEPTADNGFAAAGNMIPPMQNNVNAWLGKIDSNGSEQWNVTFGEKYETTAGLVYKTKSSITASFVSKTKDGGYFLLGNGYIETELEPELPFLLIRTDPEGNMLWNRKLGLAVNIDQISSIEQTDDGGCIISIITTQLNRQSSSFRYRHDPKLIKLDSNGSEQWNRSFGGEYDDYFSSVRQTEDGGYIIAGMTESYGYDAWLVKVDANGDEQWNRTYYAGGGSEALDVRQARDGFILAGRRISHGGNDALLIKTDPDGIERWSKTFGGKQDDEGLFVQQVTDGGYILAGTTKSYGSGNKDAWLIKVSGEPEGTENIYVVSQTETGNVMRNLIDISNETETVASNPVQTLTEVSPENITIIPSEKAAAFEVFAALTTLLFVISIRRNRRKS